MQRFSKKLLDTGHRLIVSGLMISTVYLSYKVVTGLQALKNRNNNFKQETLELYNKHHGYETNKKFE